MPCYESVFIARQDISASQAEGLTETFSQIITGNGGNVVDVESWGLRSISYRIKKNRKGHYVLMNIDAPAPALHEMERQMRIHEDVLRYMTIRVDGFDEGPSAMLRNKDRDDRPRRGDRGSRYENDSKPSESKPAESNADDSKADDSKKGEEG